MSLLAEQIVQEWLNRRGYFTIRGIKLGVQEIDLLAIKQIGKCRIERRHIEVQVSFRPVSYITEVPKKIQRESGRAPRNAKCRTASELRLSVAEWIDKKYNLPPKKKLKQELCPGSWSRELVINKVKSDEEVSEIERQGVKVHRLRDILDGMESKDRMLPGAVSQDVFELMTLLRNG